MLMPSMLFSAVMIVRAGIKGTLHHVVELLERRRRSIAQTGDADAGDAVHLYCEFAELLDERVLHGSGDSEGGVNHVDGRAHARVHRAEEVERIGRVCRERERDR